MMKLTQSQHKLLKELNVTDPTKGLSSDEVSTRRLSGNDDDTNDNDYEEGSYNTVRPPIDCPAWICCLLPCINHMESMQIFKLITPEDAEVLRNGHWIRYDSSSLVQGDIIRLQEGDRIPADCIVLQILSSDHNSNKTKEILVDLKYITGDDKPKSVSFLDDIDGETDYEGDNVSFQSTFWDSKKLYWGGHVVQGSAIAVCSAIGSNTRIAQLIQQRKFPPKPGVINNSEDQHDDVEGGISLISRQDPTIV